MKGIGLRWLVFVGILVVMLGLFGPTVPNAGAQAQNVLKIGALVPLGVKEGVEIKKWHELFAKMIDEQGGWTVGGKKYKVQFFTYDIGYMDSAKTLAAVQKAIHQDGVKYLIDNFGDVPNLTAVHADQNKVLTLGVGFGDEPVGPSINIGSGLWEASSRQGRTSSSAGTSRRRGRKPRSSAPSIPSKVTSQPPSMGGPRRWPVSRYSPPYFLEATRSITVPLRQR